MSLLMRTVHSGAGSNAVQLLPVDTSQTRTVAPCYAGIRLSSDGRAYIRQAGGGWSAVGQWLLFGSASSFNVTRTIDSGSLTTDAGAGPLALSADRTYDISNSAFDTTKRTVITLTLDAGAGDLATLQYELTATLEESIIEGGGGGGRPTWQPSRELR